MNPSADFDPEVTPSMALGGQAWPVPPLVWRDLKKCRRAIVELNDLLNLAIDADPGPEGEGRLERSIRYMVIMERVLDALPDEDYDRLVMGPVLAGLQAAHPAMTRAEFEDLRSTEAERQRAWLTVRLQSGLFMVVDAEGPAENPASGEAVGAA